MNPTFRLVVTRYSTSCVCRIAGGREVASIFLTQAGGMETPTCSTSQRGQRSIE